MSKNFITKSPIEFNKTGALISLLMANFLGALSVSIINIILPTLQSSFHVSYELIQWVIISYLISNTSLVVIAGKIGDTFNKRNIILLGQMIFIIASIICFYSTTAATLIFGRIIQGIGAAILLTLSIALIRENVGIDKLGSALGMLGSVSAIGTAAGPTIGGNLVSFFGWNSVFLLLAILCSINLFLTLKFLPIEKNNKKINSQFDIFGTILLSSSLVFLSLSINLISKIGIDTSIKIFALSAILMAIFIYYEKNITEPLVNFEIFKNLNLSIGLISNILITMVIISTLIITPFYLTNTLHLKAYEIGIIMSVGPIISTFFGFISGKLVDKFGAVKMSNISILIMILGTIFLATLPLKYGLIGFIIAIAVTTPGYQTFQSANNTSILQNSDEKQKGIVSGLLNLSRNLGLIIGASSMCALYNLYIKQLEPAYGFSHASEISFSNCFKIASIIMTIASLFNYIKNRKK